MHRATVVFGFLLVGSQALAQLPRLTAPTPLTPILQRPDLKATTPPPVENLHRFDPNRVEVVWSENHWRLAADGVLLKDFGRREAEARQALRLIRELQLDQYGTIGTPSAILEYWLSAGEAPRGPVQAVHPQTFDRASLHVESAGGQWALRDAKHVLFNFGAHGQDARQALEVFRYHGFDELIAIGQFTPSMMVFLTHGPASESEGDDRANVRQVSRVAQHESPEQANRRAAALAKAKERFPDLGSDTVVQATMLPLRTPNQPRTAFGSSDNGKRALPGVDPMADRVPFDWRQVQLRLEGSDWKLASGSLVLAHFGTDSDSAKRALEAVRYFHFSEGYRLGDQPRRFMYFLAAGQAPRGVLFGVPCETFAGAALKVRLTDAVWSLCDGERVVFPVGGSEAEANELLKAIVRYKFDRVCRLGNTTGDAGFMFLSRSY